MSNQRHVLDSAELDGREGILEKTLLTLRKNLVFYER